MYRICKNLIEKKKKRKRKRKEMTKMKSKVQHFTEMSWATKNAQGC